MWPDEYKTEGHPFPPKLPVQPSVPSPESPITDATPRGIIPGRPGYVEPTRFGVVPTDKPPEVNIPPGYSTMSKIKEDAAGVVKQLPGEMLQTAKDIGGVVGGAELAAHLATIPLSIAATPVAGLAAAATLPFSRKTSKKILGLPQHLTYMPAGEPGQRLVDKALFPFEKYLGEMVSHAGEKYEEKLNLPYIKPIVETAGEIPLWLTILKPYMKNLRQTTGKAPKQLIEEVKAKAENEGKPIEQAAQEYVNFWERELAELERVRQSPQGKESLKQELTEESRLAQIREAREKPAAIEGKPITPEERLVVKPKKPYQETAIDQATERLGGRVESLGPKEQIIQEPLPTHPKTFVMSKKAKPLEPSEAPIPKESLELVPKKGKLVAPKSEKPLEASKTTPISQEQPLPPTLTPKLKERTEFLGGGAEQGKYAFRDLNTGKTFEVGYRAEGGKLNQAVGKALQGLKTKKGKVATLPKEKLVTPSPKKGAEPWEMTRDEYIKKTKEDALKETDIKKDGMAFVIGQGNQARRHHPFAVKQALSKNKPVSDKVLKDYPELRKKTKPEPPTETLGAGLGAAGKAAKAWGKTASRVVESLGEKGKKGKKLTKEGAKNTLKPRLPSAKLSSFGSVTKIVKQRKKHGEHLIPVYEAEANVVKQMSELRTKPMGGWTETAIRTFEELGDSAKELFYRPIKSAEKEARVEFINLQKEVNKTKKELGLGSSKKIGTYAISKQKEGLATLKEMKVKIPELTPKEMKSYELMRSKFEELYDRLQAARKLSGRKPFEKVKNYFTFFRELSELEQLGFNPVTIDNRFVHPPATGFRFSKQRIKSTKALDLNAFRIFRNYTESALDHIHKSPAIAKGRELLGIIGKDKERYVLADEKPRAHQFITRWLDSVAGKKSGDEFLKLPDKVNRGLEKLNRNLTFAILSGNIRSALIQPTAFLNTVAEIGPKYAAAGIKGLLTPGMKKFAMKNSNVLITRQYDISVKEAMRGVRGKLGGAKQIAGGIGLKPLQVLDIQTAMATWMGAFRKAKNYFKMTAKEAFNYADDVVSKTQASAQASDLAPIQRTAGGKTLSLFQTFVINNWGFLTRDVMGIGNPKITNPVAFKKALTWVAGATLINIFYEDVLNMFSPLPTPIRAFREELEEGGSFPSASKEAAKEIVELVPIVGGAARWGTSPGGPVMQLGQELTEKISKKPGIKKGTGELAGKALGVPGTSQYYKTKRALKRGETPVGSVLGSYTKKNKTTSKGWKKGWNK